MVSRIRALSLTFTVALLGALALPALAGAAKPAVVTLPMAQVGAPGNPAVADRPVHRRDLPVVRDRAAGRSPAASGRRRSYP